MNHEAQEPTTTEKPDWLELPGERKLWYCTGDYSEGYTPDQGFDVLFYSADEAEAYASVPSDSWKWDKEPAQNCTLTKAIRDSRIDGTKGVEILAYKTGKWITVARYPAHVPLPLEVRE